MKRQSLFLALATAFMASTTAVAETDSSDSDHCLVEEAKEAYAEVNSSITEQTQEEIEEQSPSGEQDFTKMGCINGFSVSAQLGLPSVSLGDLTNPCSMVKDFADKKLNALNEAIGNWEGPAGLSGGIGVGTETGEGGALSDAFKKLDGYRDKLQEKADDITQDRSMERSWTPQTSSGTGDRR